MKFAAIDFETASYRSDSPCQVAVAIIDEGRQIDGRKWLIRPKSLYFADRCIAVHGIRPRDVLDQPEWDHVWKELLPIIEGHILIAHNAMFDMAVLASTLIAYGIACPRIEFQCTRLIARRCWPGRTGYGLKPTADALGIMFNHHDALEDARACAEVALAAARITEASNVESLEQVLSIRRGFIEHCNRVGPRSIRRSKADGPTPKIKRRKAERYSPIIQARTILDGCAGVRPLENKHVYLSGTLLGLDQVESLRFLESLGGTIVAKGTEKIDFWITGISDCASTALVSDDSDDSYSDEVSLDNKKSQLFINQRQLLAMIPGGLSAARAFAGVS